VAGLRAGDRLLKIDGQPIVSQADIQWVLHHAADGATLELEYARGPQRRTTALGLPTGRWRRGNMVWRELAWHLRPGMRVEALGPEQKQRLGIEPNRMALEVTLVFRWDGRARKAGFRKGDILIEVDGKRDLLSEESFLAHLWLRHRPGEHVPAKVWRQGRVLELAIPMRWHPEEY